MRAFAPFLLLGVLTTSLTAGGAGFMPLFNGKDFTGWRDAKKKDILDGKTEAIGGRFKIEQGEIVFDPAVKGDSYIETVREFGKDVHIKLELKPGPKCNNDFFLRGTKFDVVPGNKENKAVKEGEWYTLEIVVEGDKVMHKINGETVRTSKATSKSSPLKLRAEFGSIRLKNIAAKE